MKRIINFSGGRSSAMMTILEYNPKTDYVVFCDTGREHPKTYEFINDFEKNEKIPVIRLGEKNAFEKMLKKEHHTMIPNIRKRKCTIEMKIKAARRWARENIGLEYINMIGFRYDEPQRVHKNKSRWKKVNNIYPLFNRQITKYMVDQYWTNKSYQLEIPSILGNCVLCFMKGENAIINILRLYPHFAKPWIADEKRNKNGHTYLNGMTMEKALALSQMKDLFSEVDLNEVQPAFNCSCTT